MDYKKEFLEYLETVVSRAGSDLHLSVNKKPIIRIEKKLEELSSKEKLNQKDLLEFFKVATSQQYLDFLENKVDSFKQLSENKFVLFAFKFTLSNGKEVNFRGNAYVNRDGISITLRLISPEIRTIRELNLPPILEEVSKQQSGLFLFIGPIGNGKSTALSAIINHINENEKRHILTIENPIEFLYEDKNSVITQREVGRDVVDIKTGVENALRADANVIMVGEMRESEEIVNVMTAAEVGHLILSTIHASSAAQVINRIVDNFSGDKQGQIRTQLSFSLLGVCSVKLLPRINGGLVPVCEILLNNSAVANSIRENKLGTINSVLQTSREEGMISMDQALADLVSRGEVDLKVAYKHTADIDNLNKYL